MVKKQVKAIIFDAGEVLVWPDPVKGDLAEQELYRILKENDVPESEFKANYLVSGRY